MFHFTFFSFLSTDVTCECSPSYSTCGHVDPLPLSFIHSNIPLCFKCSWDSLCEKRARTETHCSCLNHSTYLRYSVCCWVVFFFSRQHGACTHPLMCTRLLTKARTCPYSCCPVRSPGNGNSASALTQARINKPLWSC